MHRTSDALLCAAVFVLMHGLPGAGLAQETVVAGWDFSQYLGDAQPTVDGATLATSLTANYSDFDPTQGAGIESAAFGTMFLDGNNGSTPISQQNLPILPSAVPGSGSLASNLAGPMNGMPSGDVAFDAQNVLVAEMGQMFFNRLGLAATAPVDVVFQADLSAAPSQPSGLWTVAFGGKTGGASSDVFVDFGPGSPTYTNVATVTLDNTDKLFSVPLGMSSDETVFVRLSVDPASDTLIDNVTIQVPEPGAVASASSALAALGLCAGIRRRRLA